MEKDELRQILKEGINEAHAAGLQSGKKETSDLAHDVLVKVTSKLDENHVDIKTEIDKHSDRFAKMDILNAQTALILEGLSKKFEKIEKQTEDNTRYITRADTTVNIFKWIIGTLGLSNIVLIVKLFV